MNTEKPDVFPHATREMTNQKENFTPETMEAWRNFNRKESLYWKCEIEMLKPGLT